MALTIDPRFNGPPDSAHGGVAAGHFAEPVDPRKASVRFEAPIPLGRPLSARIAASGAVTWSDADRTIGSVRPIDGSLTTSGFERLGSTQVDAAAEWFMDEIVPDHPFPTCFGCGHGRHDHDGMELTPGRVPGQDVFATDWTPRAAGDLPWWMVWAALDCPSGFPAMARRSPGTALVTGQLSVEVLAAVPGEGHHQVQSRLVGHEGRKFTTEAAVVDASGATLAVGAAIWIEVAV